MCMLFVEDQEGVRARVMALLLGVVTKLRAIVKREEPAYYKKFPNARRQCHTCAFRPETDTHRGADTTLTSLSRAILMSESFFCHANLPRGEDGDWMYDPKKARWCAGYGVLMQTGVHQEAQRAILSEFAGRDPKDQDVADLSEFVGRALPCGERTVVGE